MDTAEILKKVRRIEIKTKGLSKHIFSGEYHSAFKGRGMSFSEVRDYQYGDDVRNIDWNVTARTGHPHIKVFEEERELTMMLIADISKSNSFGTNTQFKNELITEICAVLAFSATQNNDKVGSILFAGDIEKYIAPKKGKKHILRIIRELIDCKTSSSGSSLEAALAFFNNVQKKRSIVFIVSDFMTRDYENALRVLSKRHDVVPIRIYDRAEETLPNVGIINALDAESGHERLIDTSDRKVRSSYSAWYQEHHQYFKSVFAKSQTDSINIEVGEDYVKPLIQFFKKRNA